MVYYNAEYVKRIIDCQHETLTDSIQARYFLSIELKNASNKIATFIMMNPSKADQNISDITVNKLIKFAFTKGRGNIGIIQIVNLFPFYETNSPNLQAIINRVQNNNTLNLEDIISNNNNIIFKSLEESKWTILAWGDPSENIDIDLHQTQCRSIIKHIKNIDNSNIYVIKTHYKNILTNNGYPRHPSRPALNGFKKCKINKDNNIVIGEKIRH
ncbi:hypothetical protein QFZ31_002298 [Neobacillus niacini]|uniref:DUF1643 domain-containing protein n=1 Tax=Neobacillus driksii TaxID=3035913 RepID=UPI002785B33B|nr:DUF1643 domain-containing protein [Neobacillus niacini]MDQ0972420.1 hypothetical protein [Neobacillus niacini]